MRPDVALKVGANNTVPARRYTDHVQKSQPQCPDPVLVTRVGLRIPSELTYDGWEQAGRRIAEVMDSSAWCLGDWLLFGLARYKDRYRRACETVGLDYQTIRNYVWVARRFEIQRRRPRLSFQHHAEVAALPDSEQDHWLDQAQQGEWSKNELRRRIRNTACGKSGSPSVAVMRRFSIQAEQIERWRTAAELSASSLESWIVSCLDAQAAAILEQQASA
jgi:hypothetical protein